MKFCTTRIDSIDAIRGVALIGMVIEHVYEIGVELGGIPAHVQLGQVLGAVGKASALTFLFLVGMSLVLFVRNKRLQGPWESIVAIWKRSQWLMLAAVLVTAASYWWAREYTVWLGVLHFIVLARLLLVTVVDRVWWQLGAALVSALVYFVLVPTLTPSSWTIVLGAPPPTYSSYDYWPLLPWILVVIAGQLTMQSSQVQKTMEHTHLPDRLLFSFLTKIGRNSLLIYVLHIFIVYITWLLVIFFHSL